METDDIDLQPTLGERMADSTTWLRLPVMILFMIVLYILVWVVGLVALVQFVIKLTTGDTQPKNPGLGSLSEPVFRRKSSPS